MSQQEQVSWISLVVGLAIGIWYFSHVLMLPADADLFGPGMARFALTIVLFSVFASIASEVSLKAVKRRSAGRGATALDERDLFIDLKACRNAYGVLSFAVVAVLVQVALLEWFARLRRHRPEPQTVLELLGTGPLAPMHVAQMLLFALGVAGLTVYVSRIVYYRRGH